MRNIFLITGEPRVGKSTLVKNLISRFNQEYFYGLITEEVTENSQRIGFTTVLLSRYAKQIASKHWAENKMGNYGVDIAAIDQMAQDLLHMESVFGKHILIIDEIGPMQVLSDEYRKIVEALLESSSALIIGTIYKGTDNKIIDAVKDKYSDCIHLLTCDNREQIEVFLTAEIEKYLKLNIA